MLMKTDPLREKAGDLYCHFSSVVFILYLKLRRGGHDFNLPKRNISKNAKKGKTQVSLYLAHY